MQLEDRESQGGKSVTRLVPARFDQTPMPVETELLRSSAAYLWNQVMAYLVLLVGGVVVARWLGPTDYGLWNALMLILTYSVYAQAGVLMALNREVPYYRGQGDHTRVAYLQNVALGAVSAVSLILLAGILIVSLFVQRGAADHMRLWLALIALMVVCQQIYQYFEVLFRAHNDFQVVGRLRLYRTLLDMVIAVMLVAPFGIAGRLWAALATWVAISVYLVRINRFDVHPALDLHETWGLVRVGLPMMLSHALIGLLATVDRVVILKTFGKTALGYYGIGLMAAGVLVLLPRVAAEVLYPHLSKRYGETGSPESLQGSLLAPNYALAYLLPVVVGSAYLVLPWFTALALPQYLPGVTAGRLLILSIFFYPLIWNCGNYLISIRRQGENLAFQAGGLAVILALMGITISAGGGIAGIALVSTVAHGLLAVTLVGFVAVRHLAIQAPWRLLGGLILPFGWSLGLVLLLEALIRPSPDSFVELPLLLARLLVFVSGGVGLLLLANRRLGFFGRELFERLAFPAGLIGWVIRL